MIDDDLYEKIKPHIGHRIAVVGYGTEPMNVAVECEDCNAVIMDADRPQEEPDPGCRIQVDPQIEEKGRPFREAITRGITRGITDLRAKGFTIDQIARALEVELGHDLPPLQRWGDVDWPWVECIAKGGGYEAKAARILLGIRDVMGRRIQRLAVNQEDLAARIEKLEMQR